LGQGKKGEAKTTKNKTSLPLRQIFKAGSGQRGSAQKNSLISKSFRFGEKGRGKGNHEKTNGCAQKPCRESSTMGKGPQTLKRRMKGFHRVKEKRRHKKWGEEACKPGGVEGANGKTDKAVGL